MVKDEGDDGIDDMSLIIRTLMMMLMIMMKMVVLIIDNYSAL